MNPRHRFLRLTAVLLLAGLTLIPARQLSHLTVDTSNQSMWSGRSQDPTGMMANRSSLLIVAGSNRPLGFPQWHALSVLANAVGETPGVDGVVLPLIRADGRIIRMLKRIHPEGGTRLQTLLGLLRSEDDRHVGMLVFLSPNDGTAPEHTQLLEHLRTLLADHPIAHTQCSILGLSVVNEAVGELIQRDQSLLLPLSAGVIILMLFLIYRNLAGILAPMAVIGLAVIWTLGIYAWRVQQLNVVTSLLAPVVMILSLATAVHVYEAYRRYRRQTETTSEAVKTAIHHVWRPCLFSALTTAAGLTSLTCSSIPAVRTFGLYGALGVLLSFLFGLSVVPLLLSSPGFGHCPGQAHPEPYLMTHLLRGCAHAGWYRKKTVTFAIAGISLLALIGLTRLHSNTNLVVYLRRDSELVRTSRFVDQHLIGVNALTCRITPDRSTQIDSTLRSRQQRFLQAVADINPINGVLAMTPESQLHRTADPWDVTLRVQAIGSRQARQLLATVKGLAQQHFGAKADVQFGGDFYRMVTESDRLVADLVRSFALALTVITLLIGIQLRSLPATVMAMVPNVLSVFWIFGAMGLAGIDLSTGTAMIACVVLGLAVDHTIHYLSFFRRTGQPDVFQAIRATTNGVGPALVTSSVILAAGFAVGMAGSFRPTLYFSLFTALAMLAALLCNLTVMPVLIGLHTLKSKTDKAHCVSETLDLYRLSKNEEAHVL